MTASNPVEFTKILADGSTQKCGNEVQVSSPPGDPLAVTGPLTNTELRAAAVLTKPQAPDGNPSEFSMATVGAHITTDSATLAAKQTYTKPATATALLAQNTGTKNIRFTLDGTDPTAAVGFVLPSGQMPVLIPCPGAAIEMILEADGAILDAQWVK